MEIDKDVLDHQREMDEQTIQALANAGADLSKPHPLEHHFNSPTPDAAAPVLAWGAANGYAASPLSEDVSEGQPYVYFDLVKGTVLAIESITSETTAMLEVAAEHGIEYDGWGCGAEK